MSLTKQVPIWASVVLRSFPGAAQYGSSSTIILADALPNVFGEDGSYIEFDVVPTLGVDSTVFGSTTTADAILINDTSIKVTDGVETFTLLFDTTLSDLVWTTIKLYRQTGVLKCDIDGITQTDNCGVIAMSLNLIGKNQSAFTNTRALSLSRTEEDYLTKSSPGTSLQGTDAGFWRSGWFKLDTVGDCVIADCLNGNSGWKVEVVNTFFSYHKLKYTVGNGTTTVTKLSTEDFFIDQWIGWYVDLEDLGATPPDPGDTTITGFDPETGNFYYGSDRGTSGYAGGLHAAFVGGSTPLSASDITWLFNSGQGRVDDEFTVSSQITRSDLTFSYGFSELSGDRVDAIGTQDLVEVPGYLYVGDTGNVNFETLDGVGGFSSWTESASGSSSVNVESAEQYAGTYCVRLDIDASNSNAFVRKFNVPFVVGKEYTARVYAKTTGTLGSFQFTLLLSEITNNITFTSNDWAQYTKTFTATTATGVLDLKPKANTGANRSLYFDNLEVQATRIGSAPGLRLSYTNAAQFIGYLKDVHIDTGDFSVNLPLLTNANDSGPDANNGTASNITWATTDPVG